ncbi:MAG: ABC transporter substrate-binding protein, partial [Pseudomonadales bacterium]|nr:ABC transporter substrate-binding protein [Pseudomonadales bacterium]
MTLYGLQKYLVSCLAAGGILLSGIVSDLAASEPTHGFSYFGDLKYPADMAHFDYVNPDAPQGGDTSLGFIGTFNSFNHLSDKGVVGAYVGGSMMFDPLMRTAEDQHGTYYALLADSVQVADDLSWVQYTLRDGGHWHDGTPITIDDILWTFDLYKNRASLGLRSSYRHIDRMEQTGPRSFRFVFSDNVERTRHMVSQTAGFTPMPKHYWETRDPTVTMIEPGLGSGPYRIVDIDPGRSYTFKRVTDYW